jgi:hypothetical protein
VGALRRGSLGFDNEADFAINGALSSRFKLMPNPHLSPDGRGDADLPERYLRSERLFTRDFVSAIDPTWWHLHGLPLDRVIWPDGADILV